MRTYIVHSMMTRIFYHTLVSVQFGEKNEARGSSTSLRWATARQLRRSWSHPIDPLFCALLGTQHIAGCSPWNQSDQISVDFMESEGDSLCFLQQSWRSMLTAGLSARRSKLCAWTGQRWEGTTGAAWSLLDIPWASGGSSAFADVSAFSSLILAYLD